jgi:plastocyanin
VSWLPIAAEITAFHFFGAALAVWAVVLSVIGMTRSNFPGKGGEKIVIGISALLVVGTVATAIGTATSHEATTEHAGAANKAGREGSGAEQGTGKAPGTGANGGSAQEPSQNAQTPPSGTSKPQTLTLSADPTAIKFDKAALEAKPGNVTIVMSNPSQLKHNISLENPDGTTTDGPEVGNGGESQVKATVAAGEYTYFCAVDGHRAAGMEGTLTVK